MIDLIYLAKGRPEFTEASAESLRLNTAHGLVRSLRIYTDGHCDFAWSWWLDNFELDQCEYGGPVAIMSHALAHPGADILCKIDNDVIVPSGWLESCLAVMESHPELDLLGIEPPESRTPNPATKAEVEKPELNAHPEFRGYAPCKAIGGIGLFRRRAFENRPLPKPHSWGGVGGFTDWQYQHPEVTKGWIVPPLKLFLLDRLPIEPWASLSKRYIAEGSQRAWTNYDPAASELWDWWVSIAQDSERDYEAAFDEVFGCYKDTFNTDLKTLIKQMRESGSGTKGGR